MAEFKGDAWSDLVKQVERAEKKVPGVFDKATKAVANRYVVETQRVMNLMRIEDTGVLSQSVKSGKIYRTSLGRFVEVWPQGKRYDKKHKNGERNETIGFVTIYGRYGRSYKGVLKGATRARDYQSAADKIAREKAPSDVLKVLEEVFKE